MIVRCPVRAKQAPECNNLQQQSLNQRIAFMSFLGIDLGTGSLKLAIIDDEGREQCATSVAYAIDTPRPGWAEIDPQVWWRALCEAASRFPEAQRSAVRAVGFSGQMHGVVLSDAQGKAVRPAMLWP